MFDCHPATEQPKAEFLEYLYEQSGRSNLPSGHPLHQTYTGLWQEFQRNSAEEARAAWWAAQQFDPAEFDR
jgi:capsid portal protein